MMAVRLHCVGEIYDGGTNNATFIISNQTIKNKHLYKSTIKYQIAINSINNNKLGNKV